MLPSDTRCPARSAPRSWWLRNTGSVSALGQVQTKPQFWRGFPGDGGAPAPPSRRPPPNGLEDQLRTGGREGLWSTLHGQARGHNSTRAGGVTGRPQGDRTRAGWGPPAGVSLEISLGCGEARVRTAVSPPSRATPGVCFTPSPPPTSASCARVFLSACTFVLAADLAPNLEGTGGSKLL